MEIPPLSQSPSNKKMKKSKNKDQLPFTFTHTPLNPCTRAALLSIDSKRGKPMSNSFEKPFEGKKALILGVANERSLAWAIAQHLHRGGAKVGFNYLGDALEKRVRPLA